MLLVITLFFYIINFDVKFNIMKKLVKIVTCLAVVSLFAYSCKKDKNSDPADSSSNNPPAAEKKYHLVIDNGAQSIEIGKSITLQAHLVNTSGASVSVSNVSWSSNIGGITGTAFSLDTDTTGIISASVSYEGVTYNASIPISVVPVRSVKLFAVLPSAIIWEVNSGSIQLETVYVGSSSPSYNFSSSNSGIASVSSSGLVSFHAVGNTVINVTSTINGQTETVRVPVLVVGQPEVSLPVTRITVNPKFGELFRGETLQLNAKAYNKNGDDVTSTVTFNYLVVQKEESDGETAVPISVSSSGLVNALATGDAYVKVTANGVMGQSEISVIADTAILVTPYLVSLGGIDPFTLMPNPTSANFTATTYKVNRTAYRAGSSSYLTQIPNPSNLTWMLPTTGISQIDNLFSVITLSSPTNSNVTATAINGKVGSTAVVAYSGPYGGAAAVVVSP